MDDDLVPLRIVVESKQFDDDGPQHNMAWQFEERIDVPDSFDV